MTNRRASTANAMARFYAKAAKDPEAYAIEAPRKKRPKPAVPYEWQEQKVVVDWLRACALTFAAPCNGAMLAGNKLARVKQWNRLASLGASKGVPDVLIFSPAPGAPRGCAVEMKRVTGGKVSDEQNEWAERLTDLGWVVVLARGADDAIKQLTALGYGQGTATGGGDRK